MISSQIKVTKNEFVGHQGSFDRDSFSGFENLNGVRELRMEAVRAHKNGVLSVRTYGLGAREVGATVVYIHVGSSC